MGPKAFRKILVANRGEIAVRILRALRETGIRSVAVFSEADRAALHVRLADEAYALGASPSRQSYLSLEKIIAAAQRFGAQAIHPGYGFLAENAAFARASAASGIAFIGPSPEAMEQLGSKTAARQLAKKIGVPTVPGTLDPVQNALEATIAAKQLGYPIVLKAVAGGGGKGMRSVERESDLVAAFRDASSEAQNAFGDGRLFLERYLAAPRHIEIQILGDHHGNLVYLGERECSIQRRHQKVIEEAPSPAITPELRRAMGEAAVALGRAGGYSSAGTVEFLVDRDLHFYFLEMNTRLQVEHPVTEMVTGLDLVKLQLQIAAGERLPFDQQHVRLNGHAIECRLYAEDPENNFLPSPGKILQYRAPGGPGIRVDDGVYSGFAVPNDYDPMLGKLIAWGRTREEAAARLRGAVAETFATGIKTNLGLLLEILSADDFVRADMYTRWLDEYLAKRPAGGESSLLTEAEQAALIAAALWHDAERPAQTTGDRTPSRWRSETRPVQVDRDPRRH